MTYTAEAVRQIEALHGKVRRQIDDALDAIARGARVGKMLRGELAGIRSERVSNYRILYREQRKRLVILVLTVAHRRLVYGDH